MILAALALIALLTLALAASVALVHHELAHERNRRIAPRDPELPLAA